jgi:hypothetical protein
MMMMMMIKIIIIIIMFRSIMVIYMELLNINKTHIKTWLDC